MRAKTTILALIALAVLGISTGAARADTSQLIGMLTSQLGVTQQQATGGAGALFGFAQNQLSPQDYQTVNTNLPGVDSLVQAAPKPKAESGLMGKVGSMLGGSTGKSLTGAEQVTQSFSLLGMAPQMVQAFGPIVVQYASEYGGPVTGQLLQGVFSLL